LHGQRPIPCFAEDHGPRDIKKWPRPCSAGDHGSQDGETLYYRRSRSTRWSRPCTARDYGPREIRNWPRPCSAGDYGP